MLNDRDTLLKALEWAYAAGYRHIDTASIYHNESIIGEFLRGKSRDELFITSKLWNDDHDNVESAIDSTLERLGIDCLDLYLVHWPVNSKGELNLRRLWEQMELCVTQKKTKSIGVSNFSVGHLSELLSFCRIQPAVNQIELHPYLPQTELRRFCIDHGIQIVCYSPLGSYSTGKDPVREDPVILGLAKKHSASASQVILSFLVGEGYCVLPRSSKEDHIRENCSLIELDEGDKEKIRGIKKRVRYVNPEWKGVRLFE